MPIPPPRDEEKDLLQTLGIDQSSLYERQPRTGLHPGIAVGLTIFGVLNVGLLMSVPPVLLGRGAPYLPTSQKRMDRMFKPLHAYFARNQTKSLRFADLGSGDGVVVFRAAREGLFVKSVGYEINPCEYPDLLWTGSELEAQRSSASSSSSMNCETNVPVLVLHLWVSTRRMVQAPKYWSSTSFHQGDMWKVDMSNYDVVAVYGLSPIMKELGAKLQSELKPGSLVLSNVFDIPGWKPSTMSGEGVHIYVTPDCWERVV